MAGWRRAFSIRIMGLEGKNKLKPSSRQTKTNDKCVSVCAEDVVVVNSQNKMTTYACSIAQNKNSVFADKKLKFPVKSSSSDSLGYLAEHPGPRIHSATKGIVCWQQSVCLLALSGSYRKFANWVSVPLSYGLFCALNLGPEAICVLNGTVILISDGCAVGLRYFSWCFS